MYYVYLLQLNNSKFYAGYSNNLKERINSHKAGRVDATSKYLSVKLVFYAAFLHSKKAIAFEKYLKSSSGFAFRNKRLI